MKQKDYYTLPEAVLYLQKQGIDHITVRTLRYWRSEGDLQGTRPLGSRQIYIPHSEVERIAREAKPGQWVASRFAWTALNY